MQAQRIILMYISEVSGHHSATLAIEKAIKMLSPEAETLNINAFSYTNPITEKIINRLYLGVIKRTPKVWDYLYDNPAVVKKLEKIKSNIHKMNSPKLKELFDRFQPSAVVCTQAFPCGMVADYKKSYHSAIKLMAVLTDYVPHSYWIYDSVDYYITPAPEVTQRLINKGVGPEKIKTLGIPFDPEFNRQVNLEETRRKFGLDKGQPCILIMGGGQGLGPIKAVVKSLEDAKDDIQEIVIAGINKKLYRDLRKAVKKYKKKILVFGYTRDINELMSVSDIIVTKPGGITTAEALTKKIPMIIIKPIPGQEINNTDFLTAKGAAIKLDRPQDINIIVEDLLANLAKLRRLSESAGLISKPNASLDIARLLLGLENG